MIKNEHAGIDAKNKKQIIIFLVVNCTMQAPS
jgi:hypothetical protein